MRARLRRYRLRPAILLNQEVLAAATCPTLAARDRIAISREDQGARTPWSRFRQTVADDLSRTPAPRSLSRTREARRTRLSRHATVFCVHLREGRPPTLGAGVNRLSRSSDIASLAAASVDRMRRHMRLHVGVAGMVHDQPLVVRFDRPAALEASLTRRRSHMVAHEEVGMVPTRTEPKTPPHCR